MKKREKDNAINHKKLLLKRIGAYAIDLWLCAFFFLIFLYTAALFIFETNEQVYGMFQIVCYILILYIFYVRFPMKNEGQTIGKMVFHIHTVYQEKNNRKKFLKVLFREFVIKYIGAVFFIPFSILNFLFKILQHKSLEFELIHDELLHTTVKCT